MSSEIENLLKTLSFNPTRVLRVTELEIPDISPFEFVKPEELGKIIRHEAREGRTIHAHGSAWSFTDAMATSGVAVSMASHNRLLACVEAEGRPVNKVWRDHSKVLPRALRDGVVGRFVHAEAGITIKDLNTKLWSPEESERFGTRPSWGLPMMGASSGQTLVGAISTGTHGGAFNRAPLTEIVRAIHLVGPGGQYQWLEPSGERRLTDPVRLREALPGVAVHQDDDLFEAALVSLGCMGVILDVIIEVPLSIALSQQVVQTTWHKVRSLLLDENQPLFNNATVLGVRHPTSSKAFGPVNPEPDSFEIFLNPYRIADDYDNGANDDRHCFLAHRARPVVSDDREGGVPWIGGGAKLNCMQLAALGLAMTTGGPGTVKDVCSLILSRARAETPYYAPAFQVLDTYDGTSDPEKGAAMELAISTHGNRHIALVDALLEKFDHYIRSGFKLMGFMSLRFTRPGRALLGMQHVQDSERTPNTRILHIEVLALLGGQRQGNGPLGIDIPLKDVPPGVKIDAERANLFGNADRFFRSFADSAQDHGARFHWGQLHNLSRLRVERSYPDTLHKWRMARTRLAAGGIPDTFSNSHSRRLGLEGYSEYIAAVAPAPDELTAFTHDGGRQLIQLRLGNGQSRWVRPEGASVPIPFAGPVAVTSAREGTMDVFAQVADGRIAHLHKLESWSVGWLPDPDKLHRFVRGPLTVTSGRQGDLHVLANGPDGRILWWHRPPGSVDWQIRDFSLKFGGTDHLFGTMSAVAESADRLHVFGHGTDRKLHHVTWADKRWSGEEIKRFPPNEIVGNFEGPVTGARGSDGLHLIGPSRVNLLHDVQEHGKDIWIRQSEVIMVGPLTGTKLAPSYESGDASFVEFEYQTGPLAFTAGPLSLVARGERLDVLAFTQHNRVSWSTRKTNDASWTTATLESPW